MTKKEDQKAFLFYFHISRRILGQAFLSLSILNSKIKNIINPANVIVHLKNIIADPNPIHLFKLITKSATNEYIVNVLCIQQNWNTLDNANIRIVGNKEQPAIVLENASGILNTAQIM